LITINCRRYCTVYACNFCAQWTVVQRCWLHCQWVK